MAATVRRQKSPPKPLTTAQRLDGIIKSARKIMRKDKGLNGDLDRLPMLTWIMFLKFLDDLERIEAERAELAGRAYRSIIEAPYRWRDWAAPTDGLTRSRPAHLPGRRTDCPARRCPRPRPVRLPAQPARRRRPRAPRRRRHRVPGSDQPHGERLSAARRRQPGRRHPL